MGCFADDDDYDDEEEEEEEEEDTTWQSDWARSCGVWTKNLKVFRRTVSAERSSFLFYACFLRGKITINSWD
jgi:hypothetical protein